MEFGGIPRALHLAAPGVTSSAHMTHRAHSGPSSQHSAARPRVLDLPLPPQTCSHMLTACLAQEQQIKVKIPDFPRLLVTFQVSIAVEEVANLCLVGIKQPPFNSSMGQEFRQDTVWVTYLCSVRLGPSWETGMAEAGILCSLLHSPAWCPGWDDSRAGLIWN